MRQTDLPARDRLKSDIARRSDAYFLKTAAIVAAHGDCRATYAVFLRTDCIVAVERAVELLEELYPADASWPLEIRRIAPEGTILASGKPLLYLTGSMTALAPLETLLLQRVGFACVSAMNAFTMCQAMPKASFIAMDARHCTGDDMHLACSYGASVGSRTAQLMGAIGFVGTSTSIAAPLFGASEGLGTMPHALIGYAKARILARGGDPETGNATLEAAKLYAETFPDEATYTVLVDYDGREITDALAVCRWFFEEARLDAAGKKLAFRIDTHAGRHLEGLDWSGSVETLLRWTHKSTPGEVAKLALQGFMIDDLDGQSSDEIRDKCLFGTGVTAASVVRFRKALDDAGYKAPTIVASSGFDVLKCRVFGNLGIPVDVVGTGSYLPTKINRAHATADIVRYEMPDGDGKLVPFDLVKVGREHLLMGNERLVAAQRER
jgi:nicotinate phosphoribosyltransferase